jgi:hypothetical protein
MEGTRRLQPSWLMKIGCIQRSIIFVHNAIPEVSAAGSITIRGSLEEANNSILLSIQDTRKGMSRIRYNSKYFRGELCAGLLLFQLTRTSSFKALANFYAQSQLAYS